MGDYTNNNTTNCLMKLSKPHKYSLPLRVTYLSTDLIFLYILLSFDSSRHWDTAAAMAQLYYGKTDNSSYRDRIPLRIVRSESELSALERAYLGAVEKGDYASVKQALEEAEIYFRININCIDPLGRTALLIAIENENLEIIELLLSYNVYVGDALLYAIRKEVVGAVELLLNHKKRGDKQVHPG